MNAKMQRIRPAHQSRARRKRPGMLHRPGFGFGVEFFGVDDSAEDAAAADEMRAGAGFDVEDEKAAAILYQARGGFDIRAGGDGFQVVHFDTCADGDGPGRQFGHHGEAGGDFHHADHGRSGEDVGEARVVGADGPFERHGFFVSGGEAKAWKS